MTSWRRVERFRKSYVIRYSRVGQIGPYVLNTLCFNKRGHILFCRIKDDHENFLKSNLPAVSQGLTNLAKFTEIHIFNYSHIVVPDLHFFFQKLRGGTFEIYRVSGSCWRRTKPGRSKSIHLVKKAFSMFT